MALWEYKVITSGRGGFASPSLLESYLNQLGTDEWEIIEFRTQPDNPLAFSGLARRPTQRDWTLEAAAAAAARAEADKLRAEFAAKFQAASGDASASKSLDPADQAKLDRDEAFRRPRDTEHDQDPYALDDSSADDEGELLPDEQLPTFFEAVRPHMRRNQKGPGYSVGVEFLIKKFEVLEEDMMRALADCGFVVPEDEDDDPVYLEYDGDIYWLNLNRRGELWINTREKPRAVFKPIKAQRLVPEVEEPAEPSRKREKEAPVQAEVVPSPGLAPRVEKEEQEPLLAGEKSVETGSSGPEAPPQEQKTSSGSSAPAPSHDFLNRLRPMMRRSRGGWSGTISYLARALKGNENDLISALGVLGLVPPASSGEKAPVVESGPFSYWLNRDGRGGIWINVRETKRMKGSDRVESSGETKTAETSAEPTSVAELVSSESPETASPVVPETGAEPKVPESTVPAALVEVAQVEAETVPPVVASEVLVGEAPCPAPVLDPGPATPIEEAVALAAVLATIEEEKPSQPQVAEPNPVEPAPEVAIVPEAPELSDPEVPAQHAVPQGVFYSETLPLAGLRLLLKETRTGGFAGELTYLSGLIAKTAEETLAVLLSAGLKAPEKPRERPVFVEHAGEVFWLNRNARGELWLNAKASKFAPSAKKDEETEEEADGEGEDVADRKPRRVSRARKKAPEEGETPPTAS